MSKLRQVFLVSAYNFRQWRKNPRVFICFSLAFILCFLLSDKAVRFARTYKTSMQIVEAFVWTYADANSILLAALLLLILFADMPFISGITPLYLVRIDRKIWLFGQVVYIVLATCLYLLFTLLSTVLLCLQQSFLGNMWSETAAILGYSGAGKAVALPALVKTLEMSTPYASMANIFFLMLLYTLLMIFIMLLANLHKGQLAGVISVFGFSLCGFLLKPQLLQTVFGLPDQLMYKANVALGWISPLNHASYHMHNFGYDRLPRLWHSYALFAGLIALCFWSALMTMRRYNFSFGPREG